MLVVRDAAKGRPHTAGLDLLLAGALTISLVEGILLAFGTGFFGDGFNSTALDSPWQLPLFAAASLALDAGLLLAIWAALLPLLRRAGIAGARAWWLLLAVGVGVPCLLAAYRYNVYSIAGDMFSIALAGRTSVSSSSSMVTELVGSGAGIWSFVIGGGLLVVLVVDRGLAATERRHPRWTTRIALPRAGPCALGAALLLLPIWLAMRVPNAEAERLRFGLERKGADIAASALLGWITDVDGDGFGPFSALPDPAPFDASMHPYALEIAGNGVDENGLGGDLRPGFTSEGPATAPLPTDGPRPHVLLFYLESFRHDLIGSEVNGRAVTPFLNQLAEEGASSDHAWAHAAWTLDSRAQLFTGGLSQRPGQTTLIDDFRALGYEVLHFSGQDESYGDSEAVLGVDRADHFYDARRDKARRSSRSTAPVSLQVSWKVLHERVSEQLDGYDGRRPLFLYVNLTDTHFPYVHDEVDDILGVAPLDRSMIRASRAAEVRLGYANMAANVDRGSRLIAERFREAIGGADHAILVLADHGEAFYEKGRLGHGQTLDEHETRIPFIVWGIGGEWPEPLAVSDVRGLLRRNLTREREAGRPVARFVPDPSRRILQYAPALSRPRVIGLRGLEGVQLYDFEHDESLFERAEGAGLPAVSAGPDSPRDELIWRWESARNALRGRG